MVTWASYNPSARQWDDFVAVLVEEVEASREVQDLLTRKGKPKAYSLVHRPLRLRK